MKKSLLTCIMVLTVFSLIYGGCAQSKTKPAVNPNTELPKETTTPTEPVPAGPQIIIERFGFTPNPLTVPVGTTVTWVNKDALYHTITSRDGLFDSGEFYLNDTFSHTFNEKGEFSYYCKVHGYSDAKVIVE